MVCAVDLHSRYPSLHDLRCRARRRLPRFVWDFFDSGTGSEATVARNRAKVVLAEAEVPMAMAAAFREGNLEATGGPGK